MIDVIHYHAVFWKILHLRNINKYFAEIGDGYLISSEYQLMLL